MIPVQFDYAAPDTLEAALKLLAEKPGAQVLAGGHSLIEAMRQGHASPAFLVDLGKIDGLQALEQTPEGGLQIGAMVTYDQVATSAAVKDRFPALAEAVGGMGDAQIRNWGRMGDVFAYQDLARDLATVALALEAHFITVEAGESSPAKPPGLIGRLRPKGATTTQRVTQTVPASAFVPHCAQAQWNPAAIVRAIALTAPPPGTGSAYGVMRHPANRSAICGVAVVITLGANQTVTRCQIAVGGVTHYPILLPQISSALEGQVLHEEAIVTAVQQSSASIESAVNAEESLNLLSDLYASSEYRIHLVGVLAKRTLIQAAKRAGIDI